MASQERRPRPGRRARPAAWPLPGGVPLARVGPGAQPVQVAAFAQQVGQLPGGAIVPAIGQGPQDLCGRVQVAALGQQPGQLQGGVPVTSVGPGAQPVQVAALGQQPGQPEGGVPVAGVGPGAQPVQVAALGQQVGQLPGGVPLAGVGPGAQPVQVAALGQQPVQLPGGVPVTGIGQSPQDLFGLLEVAAFAQQIGQPEGGIPVAGLGGVTVQRDGAAVQQPTAGAVRKPGGIGGVTDVAEDGVPGAGGQARGVALLAGVLDQVIRNCVPDDLAHVGPGRAESRDGAVQLAGGIGQGLPEPVVRRFGLLLASAIARRGGAQQAGTQRGAGAQPGHIQCRSQHRPRIRVGACPQPPARGCCW